MKNLKSTIDRDGQTRSGFWSKQWAVVWSIALALLGGQTAMAGSSGTTPSAYVAFTRPTDTISVSGHATFANQATYEAIFSVSSAGENGNLFTDWQGGAQDDVFAMYQGGIYGYAFPVNQGTQSITGNLSTQTWYDAAYVYDGSQERLYVDGVLVGSRSGSGTIGVGASSIMNIGAINRGGLSPGFLGDIVSLRISNTARYTGSSYTPAFSDFTSDSSTQLLYNFDQLSAAATTINDASGNGHTGAFGVSFAGATSPTVVVPEPVMSGMVVGALLLGAGRRRKRAGSN